MVNKVLEKRQTQPSLKVDYDRLVKAISGDYRTLQDIGNEFGVTRERIRQLVEKFHLQDMPGRQKPFVDKRKTCPGCNEKVEGVYRNEDKPSSEDVMLSKTNHMGGTGYPDESLVLKQSSLSYNLYHPECKEKKVWTTVTCTYCSKDFSIRRRELKLRQDRRSTAWTKDTIFCTRSCWGSYLAKEYGITGRQRKGQHPGIKHGKYIGGYNRVTKDIDGKRIPIE